MSREGKAQVLRERGSRWSRGNWRSQTPPPPSNSTKMKHISTCLTNVRLEDMIINAIKYSSWGKVVMNELKSKNGNGKRVTDYNSPFDSAVILWGLGCILKLDGWTLILGAWLVGYFATPYPEKITLDQCSPCPHELIPIRQFQSS